MTSILKLPSWTNTLLSSNGGALLKEPFLWYLLRMYQRKGNFETVHHHGRALWPVCEHVAFNAAKNGDKILCNCSITVKCFIATAHMNSDMQSCFNFLICPCCSTLTLCFTDAQIPDAFQMNSYNKCLFAASVHHTCPCFTFVSRLL